MCACDFKLSTSSTRYYNMEKYQHFTSKTLYSKTVTFADSPLRFADVEIEFSSETSISIYPSQQQNKSNRTSRRISCSIFYGKVCINTVPKSSPTMVQSALFRAVSAFYLQPDIVRRCHIAKLTRTSPLYQKKPLI